MVSLLSLVVTNDCTGAQPRPLLMIKDNHFEKFTITARIAICMIAKKRQTKTPKIRLIQRKEIWMLTIQGWIVAVFIAASLLLFSLTNIQPFLAVSSPMEADVLVVEGWIPDYALKQALNEFESGAYRQIITTGIPLERGSYLADYKNFAELAAATLRKLGLSPEKVIAVAAPAKIKDRTYAGAVALQQWLLKTNTKLKSINLYSYDVHTRRSWLLFKKALAPEIKVGAIAAKTLDYNPKHWWKSSAGVRSVSDEFIAYLYARFVSWKA